MLELKTHSLDNYRKEGDRLLRETGFSDKGIIIAQTLGQAVRLGGRRVEAIHGSAPEVLQTIYKTYAGQTPRTIADLESAKIIKHLLRRRFPKYSINEEESGISLGEESDFKFHVDPLDGTSSYAREQRYSTVGIELTHQDKPIVSAVCNPFERELLLAEKGRGAFLFPLDDKLAIAEQGKRIEVSQAEMLEGGIVYVDALFNNKTSNRKLALISELLLMSNDNLGLRMTGSNIDQQRQVAVGRAELTFTDAVGGFYDFAGRLAIQEAGGVFIDGQSLEPVTEKTQVAIGGNPELIRQVAPVVQQIYSGYKGFK